MALGFGAMIASLAGNEDSAKAFLAAIGKTIATVTLADDALHFEFTDGYKLRLFDDGQSCCESRYMRTDDNLAEYVGATLKGGETREAPAMPDEYGEHEVEFLVIETSRGAITLSSHNEHNGYYGGFAIRAVAA